MSILIKGVDMPKDCVSCRWHARWGCEITGIVTNAAQGCPLVEIPTPIIDKIMLIHESAEISDWIEKPWAWTLYQTWKWCDKAEKGWQKNGNEDSNHLA